MRELKHYEACVAALGVLGFEIDPAHFTILVNGEETPVEVIMDHGLPALLNRSGRAGNGVPR